MLAAGMNVPINGLYPPQVVTVIWRAMYDAAPRSQPPATEKGGKDARTIQSEDVVTGAAHPQNAAGDLTELCAALRDYEQADDDGVFVRVSRQACDEAAARIEAQQREIAELRTQRDQLFADSTRDKIRLDYLDKESSSGPSGAHIMCLPGHLRAAIDAALAKDSNG
jgi:hypothetical protein